MMRTEWQLMQEKRQAEERELTQSHGGYGGGGPPKKKTVSPVAPAGIPVASTNQIIVTNAGPYNGTYIKRSSGAMLTATYGLLQGTGNSYSRTQGESSVAVLIGPQMTVGYQGAGSWIFDYGYDDEEYAGVVFGTSGSITNASTNITTIPTTGWSSPITITAA